MPVLNHWTRWALEPWVKLSGDTYPRDCRCSRSSPTEAAAARPESMSLGWMKCSSFLLVR